MADQRYPIEILPQRGWKQCICQEEIVGHCPNALLGRKLDGDFEKCIDISAGEGKWVIYMNALPVSCIPNMSCSLLGTFFKPTYFHFLPDGEGKGGWKENVEVNETLIDGNSVYFDTITVVAWKICNVHNRTLPYKHVFAKNKEYSSFRENAIAVSGERNIPQLYLSEWEELTANPKNEKQRIVEVNGVARVNHDPTMLNYWHFTVDQYPAESDIKPLAKASEGWRYNLALNLCDYLRHNFDIVTDSTNIPMISDERLWTK